MSPSTLQASISPQRVVRFARWLLCGLVIAAGCSTVKHETEHAKVTGQVTYKGKPVTGGRVTFVATEGGWVGEGIIEPSGDYSVNAPVGQVKIVVDNSMLTAAATGKGTAHEKGMKGAGKPGGGGMPEIQRIPGTFMKIPVKYFSSETTDLTYVVQRGAQTYNIELKD